MAAKLKAYVLMCGVFSTVNIGCGRLEWNAVCDPHATALAYRAAAPVHRSIGLDVTRQVVMPADEVRARFTHDLLLPVVDFAEVWFEKRPSITFHDPLAAVAIFDEDVCGFTRGRVDVELASERALGMTHWQADPNGPHEVALEVDAGRFFESYFSVFE